MFQLKDVEMKMYTRHSVFIARQIERKNRLKLYF